MTALRYLMIGQVPSPECSALTADGQNHISGSVPTSFSSLTAMEGLATFENTLLSMRLEQIRPMVVLEHAIFGNTGLSGEFSSGLLGWRLQTLSMVQQLVFWG